MPPIIKSLHVNNFTAFHELEWKNMGSLNVITGVNDTGKTHLLKLLYTIARSFEEYNQKSTQTEYSDPPLDLVTDFIRPKLFSVFFPQRLHMQGLLTHNETYAKVRIVTQEGLFGFNIEIQSPTSFNINNNIGTKIKPNLSLQATYIPPKEVLSIFDAIVESREGSKRLAAFDDTYYDLVRDFRLPVAQDIRTGDTNPSEALLNRFESITGGGRIEYTDQELWFVRGEQRYNMHMIAEGIRKIGIFDRLIRNQRIILNPSTDADSPVSVLFLDEPETNLHPEAIVLFAEFLHDLAQSGVQVFLTTHSSFMLKRLEQLSKKNQTDYSLLDLRREPTGRVKAQETLLREGLPENPITDQSLWLYQQDVELVLGPAPKTE